MHVNNNLHLVRKYAPYLFADIISSEKRTVFQSKAEEKLTLEGQMMSMNKYPSIVSRQVETKVFILLKIVF